MKLTVLFSVFMASSCFLFGSQDWSISIAPPAEKKYCTWFKGKLNFETSEQGSYCTLSQNQARDGKNNWANLHSCTVRKVPLTFEALKMFGQISVKKPNKQQKSAKVKGTKEEDIIFFVENKTSPALSYMFVPSSQSQFIKGIKEFQETPIYRDLMQRYRAEGKQKKDEKEGREVGSVNHNNDSLGQQASDGVKTEDVVDEQKNNVNNNSNNSGDVNDEEKQVPKTPVKPLIISVFENADQAEQVKETAQLRFDQDCKSFAILWNTNNKISYLRSRIFNRMITTINEVRYIQPNNFIELLCKFENDKEKEYKLIISSEVYKELYNYTKNNSDVTQLTRAPKEDDSTVSVQEELEAQKQDNKEGQPELEPEKDKSKSSPSVQRVSKTTFFLGATSIVALFLMGYMYLNNLAITDISLLFNHT